MTNVNPTFSPLSAPNVPKQHLYLIRSVTWNIAADVEILS